MSLPFNIKTSGERLFESEEFIAQYISGLEPPAQKIALDSISSRLHHRIKLINFEKYSMIKKCTRCTK